MIAIGTIGPDLGSFGEKHAIAERHDHLTVRTRDPQKLLGDGFRLLQILPTRHDQGAVHAAVFKGKRLRLVEVLHPMPIEAGIGLQLLRVEAMADHLLVTPIVRQVAHPAAHQIQHHGTGGDAVAVQLSQSSSETAIQMLNEPGFAVKEGVVTAIQLVALVGTENLNDHGTAC